MQWALNFEGINMLYFFIVIASLVLLVLFISFICFYMAFYVPRRKPEGDEFILPKGKVYEPHYDKMLSFMKETRDTPCTKAEITSFDGLKLKAKYYEFSPDAPIELLLHGYRGTSERDLCGAVQRCFKLGHSAFIVDHRASGQSEGNIISFGVNESKDCLLWIDYILKNMGCDRKIILAGISMGASTAMITAGYDLPKNVVGVVADCGYTSAKEIIKKVVRDLKLPANILYPFIKLGAFIFGQFDLDSVSPIKAMGNCKIPVIFFHGKTDDFVPFYMSEQNFNACKSKKQLILTEETGHGLCYITEPTLYIESLEKFFN